MPDQDHPDHEQLAAFQAGDVDRRERADVEAHLAGCPSCAELVASVGRARGSLALLEEPELPPGLHDRLAAAVSAEAAIAADPGSRVAGRAGSRRWGSVPEPRRAGAAPEAQILRPAPWYRRPAAWGAAAALLLAALVVPFLNQSSGDLDTAAGGGGSTGQEAATPDLAAPGPAAAAGVPVFRIPGEVTAETVRARLDTDARAKAALDNATGGAGAPQASDQGAFRSSSQTPSATAQQLQSCLTAATAEADPATRPLAPAFFIEGTYKGREATILVTTSTPQPDRVDLWVFPRDTCGSPPLDTEQVR
ncbi:MAG TPA: zf-HC2 domain-containing protein [Actinomycetes bacterium]|nr:zf-HC2 domain-containing protein [Actinomycetes bacterium]